MKHFFALYGYMSEVNVSLLTSRIGGMATDCIATVFKAGFCWLVLASHLQGAGMHRRYPRLRLASDEMMMDFMQRMVLTRSNMYRSFISAPGRRLVQRFHGQRKGVSVKQYSFSLSN